MKKKSIVIFIHNSFKDPLFFGTVLLYLKKSSPNFPNLLFHLITYEQKNFRVDRSEKNSIIDELKTYNILWHPLNYNKGTYLLVKGYDFFKGFLLVLWLRLRYGSRAILSLANIAGGFSFIYGKLLGMKIILYQYEPHSEFLADFGMWSSSGIKFKLLNKIERIMGIHSDYVLPGTDGMIERLLNWKSKAKIYKVPTCVNNDKFVFSKEGREQVRTELKIQNKKVFLYLGKFGGIYYNEEIAFFCKVLYRNIPDSFFLIVTPNDKKEISTMFQKIGLSETSYFVTESPYEIVQNYISAADIGIVAIPPYPSQKFRSPVKVGEYLLCGIPFIVCKGISDDDKIAEKYYVGVVVNDFSEKEIVKAIPKTIALLIEEKQHIRHRTRKAGIEYRGTVKAVQVFNIIFEQVFAQ